MIVLDLPKEIEAMFREFRTCELSTLAKDGTPITWPTSPLYQPEKGHFLIATSIGLPQKAFNIRRNPRVSLLFSDSTGSGLVDPPAVLVQGDAEAQDEIVTMDKRSESLARVVFSRQPVGEMYSSNALLRYLFDWYYMRLLIYVTPRRILWLDKGDFARTPHEMEVNYVG
jgi:nitroimidazol reductase NimA-like FMN-containing flavoprotein (pyridoxamine 5'-phosphate oxidase superfamily)